MRKLIEHEVRKAVPPGKGLYRQANAASFMEDARENRAATVKSADLLMGHLYLPRRIADLPGD